MELPYSLDRALRCRRRGRLRRTTSLPATFGRSCCAAMAKSASTPRTAPIEVYIANFPWGKYVAGTNMARMCASPVWNRLAPNTMPALAKAGANYMNSQLIRMEADINGYAEGIALDVERLRQRRLGRKCLHRPQRHALHVRRWPTLCSPASRATAFSPLRATSGIPVVEQSCRARCSTSPTKSSSREPPPKSRPSARSTALSRRRQDGADHREDHDEFFAIANGLKPDRFGWLTPVKVNTEQQVTA